MIIFAVWGGDPVYPTVNYIQDPDEVIDYRGPDFHEPTPDMLAYLKEHGKIISREQLNMLLSKEKTEELEMTDMDDAIARAVDIGEKEEEGEDSEAEGDEEQEKISRNWSVLKSTPQLRKSKAKPKKDDPMSLDEAIDDSENLTDFLLDFEEEE
ncbi:protein PLASTID TRANSCRIPTIONALLY ACTIVE 12, chloroplastic-like isoform X2 [Pistacia vera]|uniref:protein PLASTID TRANSCRIPTIONALLY ACTIVE 12, chloroplastic-like isoform X2 n=1 Tax=Pistacia vera TaxID=55513 RepID=UPI001263C994|nr:protein PLASTID TRANSCRIPTIONALLY ACTIVE 12, chloroplastic-like isoform X2 [Pistacia vera]